MNSDLVHLRRVAETVVALGWRFDWFVFDVALLLDSLEPIGSLLKLDELLDDLVLQRDVGHRKVGDAEERLERHILDSGAFHVDLSQRAVLSNCVAKDLLPQ